MSSEKAEKRAQKEELLEVLVMPLVTLWLCETCDKIGGWRGHWNHEQRHCGKSMRIMIGDQEELKEKLRKERQ